VKRDGRWQLHPWVEIHTGTWMPVDPATPGRATANRVRLAVGGEARLLDLVVRAGRLRLRVLEDTQ
jgi:hypothetical protein